jgi:hypothetical protein
METNFQSKGSIDPNGGSDLPALSRRIYTTFRGGFGDCWATASFLGIISQGMPIYVNAIDPRIVSILPHLMLDTLVVGTDNIAHTVFINPAHLHDFVSERGYAPSEVIPWKRLFALPYLPTRVRWAGKKTRQIAYQLVPGKTGPTTCKSFEIDEFLSSIESRQILGVSIGQHLSLHTIIQIAAESAFFVGVDSGMSHLCHSVGIPCVLIRNSLPVGYLQVTHLGKSFTEYSDLPAFLQHLDIYIREYLPTLSRSSSV